MLHTINDLGDPEPCKSILAVLCFTHRPITLKELGALVDLSGFRTNDEVKEVIESCGSFLTLQGSTVSFVHQSANDHLTKEESMKIIFSDGLIERQHEEVVVLHSISAMGDLLRRDICNMRDLGCYIEDIGSAGRDPDPLETIRYCCTYWLDHLCEVRCGGDGGNGELDIDLIRDDGEVHKFLMEHLLHWLEALSIMKSIPGTTLKLVNTLEVSCPKFKIHSLKSTAS
ncbi:hypothetical protein TWF506_009292 [Arthrobotrys conoides]|uniref:Uncharacterized protein n=1 Tax=Arthrobotrys conoides TaxID=74498 RepID=A0AAN8N4R1_9PEZI